MKIAIVLSGRNRFFEESGFCWKNNIIKQNPNIEFDFYCHFWNDNISGLDKKIIDAFNPGIKVQTAFYDLETSTVTERYVTVDGYVTHETLKRRQHKDDL